MQSIPLQRKHRTRREEFRNLINQKYGTNLESYRELHHWSTENYTKFWEEVWHFVGIISSSPYSSVIEDPHLFIGTKWFPGSKLNLAENLLRFKDDGIALLCIGEEDDTAEKITYKELYNEVRAFAAALKSCGLCVGDTVACHLPNIKEVIFTLLAVISLGGVIGGVLPLYGAQRASEIMNVLRPKFLFMTDRFYYERQEYIPLENLPQIIRNVDSIEKVIIIPNRKGGSCNVKLDDTKCVSVEEFLDYGKNEDGSLPELRFEQLPSNHPVFVSFTSGTIGNPKRIVHSALIILSQLKSCYLHYGVTRKDIFLMTYPIGWIALNIFIGYFGAGATMALYSGEPFYLSKTSLWDVISEHRITSTFFCVANIQKMLELGNYPRPDCDLSHVHLILLGASPVTLQTVEFLYSCIKSEEVLIGSGFGATEMSSSIALVNENMPKEFHNLLIPELGSDIRCFDEKGNSVLDKSGELVIAKPLPNMPVAVIGDTDDDDIRDVYLSQYPGVWCQSDMCIMDSKSGAITILGRSDLTLNPKGERFGPAEIYNVVLTFSEVVDCICVGQNNDNLEERAVLFVKLQNGLTLSDSLQHKIRNKIELELTEDHVPEVILQVEHIPYNFNNKRMESVVKKIINTNRIPKVANARNPEYFSSYLNIPALQNF